MSHRIESSIKDLEGQRKSHVRKGIGWLAAFSAYSVAYFGANAEVSNIMNNSSVPLIGKLGALATDVAIAGVGFKIGGNAASHFVDAGKLEQQTDDLFIQIDREDFEQRIANQPAE